MDMTETNPKTGQGPSCRTARSAVGTKLRRATRAGAAAALALSAAGTFAVLSAASASADAPGTLGVEAVLPCGHAIGSGGYTLNMQCDGNLVERGPTGVVWSSRTNGPTDGYYLKMQGDGNLVIYTSGGVAIFATGTNVTAGNNAVLEMQDDGNAVVYASGHVARWATKSRAEAAITWYYSRIGNTQFDYPTHRCEAAAEQAFGVSPGLNTALDDWRLVGSPMNAYTSAPRGTLVFYRTSPAGHVALSLGNGKVISSTSKDSRNAIGTSPISGWFTPGLGWAVSAWGTPW